MIRALVNLIVLAAIVGVTYFLWNLLKPDAAGVDEDAEYAQRACVDEASSRYDITAARPMSVSARNGGGYVVRVSITLKRGASGRVTCLTSAGGRVENITVEE